MNVAGLFSGIGGFELAFSRAGFQPVLLCETDPSAEVVLKKHFADVDLWGDVSKLDRLPPNVDVLTAGFPCQDLSMVGPRKGISGPKSGVVEEMFRLITKTEIPTIVIENVYFMLHLDRGAAMNWLVERFERLGYDWAYRVLDTMGFGLPQRRRRVYFIASKTIDPRTVLFADEADPIGQTPPDLDRPLGFYWTEGRHGIGLTVDGIPPLKIGSAIGIPSAPAVLFPDGEVLMPSVGACERIQGFPAGWIPRSKPDVSRKPEWRLIGNAVSVPVVRWVAGRLRKPGSVLNFAVSRIPDKRHWPDAAWSVAGQRWTVDASDRPVNRSHKSISAFRDKNWTRLSDRALDGFINRVLEGGLRTPDGFVERLVQAGRKPPLRVASSVVTYAPAGRVRDRASTSRGSGQ